MKRGVTVTVLAITIAVMAILVSTSAVVGVRAIQTAAYEEFISKVIRVTNDVNEYVVKNNELPTTMEIVSKEGLAATLVQEITKKGDINNTLYVIDMAKLKTESVNIGSGTVGNLDVFLVAENTNNVYYLKGITYKGNQYYGLDVTIREEVPASWQSSVTEIVNGVPIPKGFVASQASGENTKSGGLVIYEGTEAVTDANVEWARRNRNQYVWIPVTEAEFKTQFIRQNFMNPSDTTLNISNALGTANQYWETVIDTTTNTPSATENNNTSYISSTTLAEAQKMYASVKKYQGFYMARYEAGLDTQRFALSEELILGDKVYSMMNKIPYVYVSWGTSMSDDAGGAAQVARSVYTEANPNYGVVSTLAYGVQWDAVIYWWQNSGIDITNSNGYGNYLNQEITAVDLNEGAMYADFTNYVLSAYEAVQDTIHKEEAVPLAFSTGALKSAKVNNIYDMAGNMWEWTMEGYSDNAHVIYGGSFGYNGDAAPAAYRAYNIPGNGSCDSIRIALYIK